MRLADYLSERGESQASFARRAGLPQSTVNFACSEHGRGVHADTAYKIIQTTGGLVTLADLRGDRATLHPRRRQAAR